MSDEQWCGDVRCLGRPYPCEHRAIEAARRLAKIEADSARLTAALAASEAEVARLRERVAALRLEGQRLATTVAWVADGQGQADGMVKRALDDLDAWRAALADSRPAGEATTDHPYEPSKFLGHPWCGARGCLNAEGEHAAAVQEARGDE